MSCNLKHNYIFSSSSVVSLNDRDDDDQKAKWINNDSTKAYKKILSQSPEILNSFVS